MQETNRDWLTVKEAADRARLSEWSIYQACERNEIRHIRVGGRRTIRLTPAAIDDWLLQHERVPVRPAAGVGLAGQQGGSNV